MVMFGVEICMPPERAPSLNSVNSDAHVIAGLELVNHEGRLDINTDPTHKHASSF